MRRRQKSSAARGVGASRSSTKGSSPTHSKEDDSCTRRSRREKKVSISANPYFLGFTQDHRKQGHSHIQAVFHLPEIGRTRILVEVHADLGHPWERMHHNHILLRGL